MDGKRCNGAPDFIIEIVSSGNPSDDYVRKLYYYQNYGVREYWIADPRRKTVTVNYFEGDMLNIPLIQQLRSTSMMTCLSISLILLSC